MPLPEALSPLEIFVDPKFISRAEPTYWYEGKCPRSGAWLRLPRTDFVEAIAQGLMQHLTAPQYNQEGKMYGVLLVKTPTGELAVLKAFSGLLNGESHVPGWVPPIPGREQVAREEAQTLAALEAIKTELLQLQQLPERQEYERLRQQFETQLQNLSQLHQQRKEQRFIQRQSGDFDQEILDEQSRRDGIEKRHLKRQRDQALQPLKEIIQSADTRIQHLKRQRKRLSQTLQAQMHTAYRLMNFAGQSISLEQLVTGSALPTGTGECCAPKLLHYAAMHHYQPIAMAEFWWGASTGEKVQGKFYGACVDRCQPLMGFLLSGLEPTTLPILYEDEWLMVVDKPAGLLSVPGRSQQNQDCVLERLRDSFGSLQSTLWTVHRLDQDTSGILLVAKETNTFRQLSQQFQQRRVHKIYEAVLAGWVSQEQGTIDLPLWSDPRDRPRQKVDFQRGKPSITHFRAIARDEQTTRIEFKPITGRTHQLRVHAADPHGLGVPILGDRLYGSAGKRLHLHARELTFEHPQTGDTVRLKSPTPF